MGRVESRKRFISEIGRRVHGVNYTERLPGGRLATGRPEAMHYNGKISRKYRCLTGKRRSISPKQTSR